MNAKELRIGNWVNKNGYFRQILGVHSNSVIIMNTPPLTLTKSMDIHINKIEPIPLTEEILLKCGFKDIYNKMWLILEGSPNIEINKSTFQVSVWETINDETEGIYLNNIKYLHQLQNLYFALTGKELNITL